MKKMLSLATLGALTTLTACSTSPDEIGASYVSPLTYQSYDCEQVVMEMDRVGRKSSDLYAQLDKKATNDQVATGVGMVLFWPALFFIDGDGPEAQEYARLKGEYEALEDTAIQKKCAADTLPPSPKELLAEKRREAKAQAEQDRQNESDSGGSAF